MTSDFDYKKYSLEKLQEWVHDAMNSDASPHEIYSAIREAVCEEYYYHKDCISRASGLLELLSGHRPVKDTSILQCNKDDKSPECQDAWNDFWEENYYPEEHQGSSVSSVNLQKEVEEIRKAGGYDWTPEVKKYKPKKWVLPVEECKDADTDETEYFVSLPDDLLYMTNLKEGDQVEWVDQGDGSYLLRKVTQPLGMDEC
jgi:hypothetical protein